MEKSVDDDDHENDDDEDDNDKKGYNVDISAGGRRRQGWIKKTKTALCSSQEPLFCFSNRKTKVG